MRVAESDYVASELDTATEFYRYYPKAPHYAFWRRDHYPRLVLMEHWDGEGGKRVRRPSLLVELAGAHIADHDAMPGIGFCFVMDGAASVPLQRIIESDSRRSPAHGVGISRFGRPSSPNIGNERAVSSKKAGERRLMSFPYLARARSEWLIHCSAVPVIGKFSNMAVEPQRQAVWNAVRIRRVVFRRQRAHGGCADHEKYGILAIAGWRTAPGRLALLRRSRGELGSPGLPAVFLAESVRKLTLLPDDGCSVGAKRRDSLEGVGWVATNGRSSPVLTSSAAHQFCANLSVPLIGRDRCLAR